MPACVSSRERTRHDSPQERLGWAQMLQIRKLKAGRFLLKTFFRSRGHGVERAERGLGGGGGAAACSSNKRQKGEGSTRERFLIHTQKLPKLYCQNVYIFMCLSTVSYGNLKTME